MFKWLTEHTCTITTNCNPRELELAIQRLSYAQRRGAATVIATRAAPEAIYPEEGGEGPGGEGPGGEVLALHSASCFIASSSSILSHHFGIPLTFVGPVTEPPHLGIHFFSSSPMYWHQSYSSHPSPPQSGRVSFNTSVHHVGVPSEFLGPSQEPPQSGTHSFPSPI